MSTSLAWREAPAPGLASVFAIVDPRCAAALRAELALPRQSAAPLRSDATVVVCGHRAAGKSRLLPWIAERIGRPGLDLDQELERSAGRSIRDWYARSAASFRQAERARFEALPPGVVVAVGGGFLSLHAELLRGHLAVEVPLSLPTYRERLRADHTRPRLRPELSDDDELLLTWFERSAEHRRARPLSLGAFLRDYLGVSP